MTDSTMVVLGMTSLALVVVLYVWFALALAAMFRKMQEPSWKAWVPVLNVATVLQRGDFSPWLVLLNVVPLFGAIAFVVVFIVAVHRITVAFGGGAGLTVVGALFPVVWASILGWGSARWSGEGGGGLVDERSGPFRRGNDHAPAYVPLVGGWTPDAAAAWEAPSAEPAGWAPAGGKATPESAWERGHWTPDAPIAERGGPEPAPASEPVVMPFAAPSLPLADAVPSAIDWSAPVGREMASFDEQRRSVDAVRSGRTDADADAAVSDVLNALRDDAPRSSIGPRRGLAVDALQGLSASRADHDRPSTDAPALVPVAEPSTRDAPNGGEPAASASDEHPDAPDDAVAGPESSVGAWSAPSRRAARTGAERAAPIADVPLTRPAPETAAIARPSAVVPGDEFPELSEAVSAVSEVPEAGSPRSARTSVSSLYAQSAVPDVADDDPDALDRTVVTRRKRIPWMLVPPGGAPVALTSDVVILGRRPSPDAAHPDAQLVAISDETRTVSKTHARLQLRGETWYITDLDSTNGVLFATLMGTEVEAPRGEEIEAGARFFLGDAEVRLARSDT